MMPTTMLEKTRETLIRISAHAKHGMKNGTGVVDAMKHLDLIRLMADLAIDRMDGKESHL